MVQFDTPINANDASFEWVVLQAPLPVVTVFWSAQETPRQQLNAVLEQTAREYAGEALVVKLDVADSPQAHAQYGVETLPQFLFFRQGKLVARARGMPDADMLRPWVEYLLERGPKPASRKPPQEGAPAGDGHPLVVTDADFEQTVLRASVPSLVDFWAAWCGPCKMMAPFFEQAATELEPHVRLAKVNTDENPMLAQRYQINSIPTTAVFKGGREVARQPGAMNLPQLLQWIKSNV